MIETLIEIMEGLTDEEPPSRIYKDDSTLVI
mgnify:FL=1